LGVGVWVRVRATKSPMRGHGRVAYQRSDVGDQQQPLQPGGCWAALQPNARVKADE